MAEDMNTNSVPSSGNTATGATSPSSNSFYQPVGGAPTQPPVANQPPSRFSQMPSQPGMNSNVGAASPQTPAAQQSQFVQTAPPQQTPPAAAAPKAAEAPKSGFLQSLSNPQKLVVGSLLGGALAVLMGFVVYTQLQTSQDVRSEASQNANNPSTTQEVPVTFNSDPTESVGNADDPEVVKNVVLGDSDFYRLDKFSETPEGFVMYSYDEIAGEGAIRAWIEDPDRTFVIWAQFAGQENVYLDPAISEVVNGVSYMTLPFVGDENAFDKIIITVEETQNPLIPSTNVLYEKEI
ncbi:hypothetical protein LRY65_03360 [Candidatus Woesebacteria bacterium]|nr:hypothetical protein [Candidatus Woesebacteria bacterium]MCD8506933.1 hypothetical protein [Candidatus Woesebacteria bacterium]MCD8527223.1 hypothetical protein [Candidatus Woesebacteria bacterium]MCD8546589.1 hypothetical protein [Candidatus Woesebacteria bacterium]